MAGSEAGLKLYKCVPKSWRHVELHSGPQTKKVHLLFVLELSPHLVDFISRWCLKEPTVVDKIYINTKGL